MGFLMDLIIPKGGQPRPFVTRYRNARKAITQIKSGEWTPEWNSLVGAHLAANRGDLVLWLGNGPFFCDIMRCGCCGKYFGRFWRHWVWWAAARRLKKSADYMRTPEL